MASTMEIEVDDGYVEYIPVKRRRLMENQRILQRKAGEPSVLAEKGEIGQSKPAEDKPSLLFKASQMKRDLPEITPMEQKLQEEKELIEHISDGKALMPVQELAKGITYTEPLGNSI